MKLLKPQLLTTRNSLLELYADQFCVVVGGVVSKVLVKLVDRVGLKLAALFS
jgi:hypothetical protein